MAIGTLFSSCHDNIYEMISKEVALESNGITGDIRSIVPFKKNLYLTNGFLYKKTGLSSTETRQYNKQWAKISTNGIDCDMIIYIASDETYLYALTADYEENENDGENVEASHTLYCSSDGTSWSKVDTSEFTSLKMRKVFDNQVQSYTTGTGVNTDSGRKAYLRVEDSGTYKLNGTAAPQAVSGNNASSDSCMAATIDGSNDYFVSYYALASNYNTDIPTKLFYWSANGSTLYWGTDTASATGSVDLDDGSIYSISVTSSHLLLGTSSGIKRVAIDSSGVPSSSTEDFSGDNNAESLLTNRIYLTYVLDQSKPEASSDEYAWMTIHYSITSSSLSFDEIGLYSFYPGRGTWNRDGTADDSSDGN